jgi:hypothetical protein
MKGMLPVWLLATLGDLLYAFLIIAIVSLSKRNVAWMRDARWSDMFAASILGFLIALMVEYKGLYLGRWAYTAAMPITPFFRMGLSPLIQMTLLTPLSLFILRISNRHAT